MPAPTTSVPTTTTALGPTDAPQFVGITTDGRLVVVDVATGQEVRELDRAGDPNAVGTPEDPIPPNWLESVEVVPGSTPQILYGDCCEPAVGNVFAIGIDGSPTTLGFLTTTGERPLVTNGSMPAVNREGELASIEGSLGLVIRDIEEPSGYLQVDRGFQGTGGPVTWLTTDEVAYEAQAEDGTFVRVVSPSAPDDVAILDAPGEAVWTDPVGYAGQLLVAEGAAQGRIVDPATGEVVASFAYDGTVVDQDLSTSNQLLVTYDDGRVAQVDPDTGESRVIATGFIAASW